MFGGRLQILDWARQRVLAGILWPGQRIDNIPRRPASVRRPADTMESRHELKLRSRWPPFWPAWPGPARRTVSGGLRARRFLQVRAGKPTVQAPPNTASSGPIDKFAAIPVRQTSGVFTHLCAHGQHLHQDPAGGQAAHGLSLRLSGARDHLRLWYNPFYGRGRFQRARGETCACAKPEPANKPLQGAREGISSSAPQFTSFGPALGGQTL